MRTTRRTSMARWGGALLLAVAPLPWLGVGAASATPSDDGEHQVTICHRTNAVANPYVVITVDYAAADGAAGNSGQQPDHYGEHQGPVFDPDADYQPPMNGDEWGDIIPPIEGAHNGLNWDDAGIAIWENDCTIPVPEPSETVTTTEPEPSETVTTTPPVEDKVILCHATASASNPYVVITVAVSAADGDLGNDNGKGDHYAEHTGPIFDPEVNTSGDDWGDIIPPIEGVHDGLNWTEEGQAIFEEGCEFPTPEPSETVTTTEPEPSETVTTTEPEPSETVTTTEPEPSETVTSTSPGPTITGSSSQPEPGPSDTSVAPTRSERPGPLPQTGSGLPIGSALAASFLLIGLGALLLAGPGRLAVDRYQRKH